MGPRRLLLLVAAGLSLCSPPLSASTGGRKPATRPASRAQLKPLYTWFGRTHGPPTGLHMDEAEVRFPGEASFHLLSLCGLFLPGPPQKESLTSFHQYLNVAAF
ncbi:coagulation factor II thrombin receptor [Rhinolophus ferrumequinum]|uniref:Coagulation factor II thrombin receptor n=1 Tax=Rhinolophus ferrumequinum TaxID=59479 RepID=A0A7J7Y4J0_RHIFE|nr:coagulation factor II thrombin receptor [Rhinolophus ferrumequinum]